MSNLLERLQGMSAERRHYTLERVVQHLYEAQAWRQLFGLLNDEQYGQAKLHHDPSTQGYGQDLVLGQQATTWDGWTVEEALGVLPNLWRYTLLRCSLVSRADKYPPEAFQLLLQLKREQEALGLVSLLTQAVHRAKVLLCIAQWFKEQGRDAESLRMLTRAEAIAYTIELPEQQAEVLADLVLEFARMGQQQAVERAIQTLKENSIGLGSVARALSQAGQFERARAVAVMIQEGWQRDASLQGIACALARDGQWQPACSIAQSMKDRWIKDVTVEELAVISAQSGHVQQTKTLLPLLKDESRKAHILGELGLVLVNAGQQEQAEEIWNSVERMSNLPQGKGAWSKMAVMARQLFLGESSVVMNSDMLKETMGVLAQAEQWQSADDMIPKAQKLVQKSQKDPAMLSNEKLRKVAVALALAGRWQRAVAVVPMIQEGWQGETLKEIVLASARVGQVQQAKEIAWSIKEKPRKVEALGELGLLLAQSGQMQQAQALWDEAEKTAHQIEGEWLRASTLRDLIWTFVQAQYWPRIETLWEEADEIARRLESGFDRSQTQRKFAMALAQAGQWQRAEALTRGVEEDWQKNASLDWLGQKQRIEAFVALARAFVQAGQDQQANIIWHETEALMFTFEESDGTREALAELGDALVALQQWDEAELLVRLLGDDWYGAKLLRELGTALAQAGEWEHAEAVVQKIQEYWDSGILGYQGPQKEKRQWGREERAEALIEFGVVLAQTGREQQAEAIWGEAETTVAAIKEEWVQAKVLKKLWAVAYMRQGQRAEVEILAMNGWKADRTRTDLAMALIEAKQWERAETVIRAIEQSVPRTQALGALAVGLVQVGEWERAETVADTIKQNWDGLEALGKLAVAFTRAGQQECANVAWDKAEKAARSIEGSRLPWALRRLGIVLAQSGQWQRAEIVAYSIKTDRQRIEVLWEVVIALARAGQWQQAETLWNKTKAEACMADEGHLRVKVLSILGAVLAQAVQEKKAEMLWNEAEAVAFALSKDEELSNYRDEALRELGNVFVQTQQWERAETVARAINDSQSGNEALEELGAALIQAEQWQRVEEFAYSLDQRWSKAKILQRLIVALNTHGKLDHALRLTQQLWLEAKTRKYAINFFPIMVGFLPHRPEIGRAFYEAFVMVNGLLRS